VSAIEIPGYKIIKTLGVGGQATVYLAIQQGFDREVALKVMSPALAADPTFGERFIREAKIVAKLSHPRIVTVYDVGESGSFYYLAMEYMRGGDLKAQIARGLKAKEGLIIIAKLAQALHFAHKNGYVHRDVKSENILFDKNGQPVLTDFGIAKASNSATQMTQTGKLIGTPEYMSPEQCRGKKLDGRSDIYSLGIILYEMMARKVPYSGSDSVSVCILHVTKPVPTLPARLAHFQWLIDRMLDKNPDKRFQTGHELSNAIKNFLRSADAKDRGNNKPESAKPTKISKKANFARRDDFSDESFELSDNFHVDQRINVLPETKSRVPMIATIFILIIAISGGYVMKDQWLPKVRTMLAGEPEIKQIAETPKLNNSASKNKNDNTKLSETTTFRRSKQPVVIDSQKNEQMAATTAVKDKADSEKINKLIQQADTLAQYSPHELTDIQQALDHLITAKSLDPTNDNVTRIKSNIIQIALDEVISSAKKDQFEQAANWLSLVESADGDNAQLEVTKQVVVELRKAYDSDVVKREADAKKLVEVLAEAQLAISENRLGAPEKNNAVYYYQSALNLDENNTTAKNGLDTVAKKYITIIDNAIKKNKFQKAKKDLNILKNIPLVEINFAAIEGRMSTAKKRYAEKLKKKKRLAAIADKKRKIEAARQEKLSDPLLQMQLQSKLQAARDLMAIDQLVEPIGDNALEKYRAALEIDHLESIAIAGIKEIEKTIVENLDVAISNSLLMQAKQWISKLKVFDPNYVKLQSYQIKIDEMMVALEMEQANNQPVEVESPIGDLNDEEPTILQDEVQEKNQDPIETETTQQNIPEQQQPTP